MMCDYTYVSDNTLELTSLHDCHIESIQFSNDYMKWSMSHLDILPEHNLNPFDMPKQTDCGLIKFDNYRIINMKKDYGVTIDNKTKKPIGEPRIEIINSISREQIELLNDTEVLQCTLLDNTSDLLHYYFLINTSNYLIELEIECGNVKICWNEYKNDAWFARGYKGLRE